MDFHRMVWGLTYQFNDRMALHTEVDFEHATKEMELELTYLDFLIKPGFNVRAGSMLMPVGPLNEFHEPPLFYSVERPYVQNHIIPTTWGEGGVGIFGTPVSGLKYRLYLVSTLQAEKFSDSSGLRDGRGKFGATSSKPSPSDSLAAVGRLEYTPLPGLDFGVSIYQGDVTGSTSASMTALDGVGVGITEADIRFRKAGFDIRAVYAKVDVDNAAKINALTGKTGNKGIGEEMVGQYVEVAYHLATPLKTKWDLVPFVRQESFNTQEAVPTGFTANMANEREVMTYGLAYYPIPEVAVKLDVENWEDATGNEGTRRNFGLAYMF